MWSRLGRARVGEVLVVLRPLRAVAGRFGRLACRRVSSLRVPQGPGLLGPTSAAVGRRPCRGRGRPRGWRPGGHGRRRQPLHRRSAARTSDAARRVGVVSWVGRAQGPAPGDLLQVGRRVGRNRTQNHSGVCAEHLTNTGAQLFASDVGRAERNVDTSDGAVARRSTISQRAPPPARRAACALARVLRQCRGLGRGPCCLRRQSKC